MTEKQAEKLALPIIGIVLGSLGLLLSWVPIINNFAFFLAIIALILTGISFLVNRGGKKTLTYVSLGLAIATGAIVMMTQASYSKTLESVSTAVKSENKKSDDKQSESKSEDKKSESKSEDKSSKLGMSTDVSFDLNGTSKEWTQADYDSLKTGSSTGAGGQSLESVKETFGDPTSSVDTSLLGLEAKSMSWDNIGSDTSASVTMTFFKQSNGDWLLADKSQTNTTHS